MIATLSCAKRGALFGWEGPAHASADGIPAARTAFATAIQAIAFAKGVDPDAAQTAAGLGEPAIDIGQGFHEKDVDAWTVSAAMIDAANRQPGTANWEGASSPLPLAVAGCSVAIYFQII